MVTANVLRWRNHIVSRMQKHALPKAHGLRKARHQKKSKGSSVNHYRAMSRVILKSSVAVLAIASCASLSSPASASNFQVIHDFTGGKEGGVPGYTLLRAGGDSFIGTANQGGKGYGTVFKLSQKSGAWTVKPLYDFKSEEGQPGWGIIHGSDGSLFVNASYAQVMDGPCGSALELDRSKTPANRARLVSTLLHTYVKGGDGCPTGNLLRDSSGNLFGVTQDGGANGWGSVFELSAGKSGWTETILYSFRGQEDGGAPYSELISDDAGNLYGTASASSVNFGTVFELSPGKGGWTYNVLYAFAGGADRGQPVAALTFGKSGKLYGATTSFGANGGGTIFRLAPGDKGWKYKVLYSLSGSDGPVAALALSKTGTIYGTNFMDGAAGYGSVFSLAPSGKNWTYSDLHDFTGGADGGYPGGGVVFDSTGNLYGTAVLGGANGAGVLYKVTP
jgi:uncharacterized repeat protein (TIGR03803 family)